MHCAHHSLRVLAVTEDIHLSHSEIQKFMLDKNGNLERHEFFKDRGSSSVPNMLQCQRPGETFDTCGSVLQGITEEVEKQAE